MRILIKLLKFLYRIISPLSVIRIFILHTVRFRILAYSAYKGVLHRYGADCTILSCATYGTGDYYFSGMYLGAWLKENAVVNYVFLAPDAPRKKIIGLFGSFDDRIFETPFGGYMNRFSHYLSDLRLGFHYFLHAGYDCVPGLFDMAPNPSRLFGYRGFTILDFYLYLGFQLPRKTVPKRPLFASAVIEISGVRPTPKTILIAPYAVSYVNDNGWLWQTIAASLSKRGYTVYTNCGGKEKPLPGTKPLFAPYVQSVPFLNLCAGFIGIRSGLCDIVSTAACKKIIIHPYRAVNWPDGTSLAFTGLKNMGLCGGAIELELTKNNKNAKAIIKKILEEFPK